jgi:predicted acyltransferase
LGSGAIGERLPAIDRFRGMAIVLMVLANFLSGNSRIPSPLKHTPDIGLTAIDLIAPLFIFAIGLTYVASARRRSQTHGARGAVGHVVVRYLALCGIGAVISAGEHLVLLQSEASSWGVLQSIGVAGLLALPVSFASRRVRFAYGVVLLIAHQLLAIFVWRDQILDWGHGGLPGALAWGGMLALSTTFGDLTSERHWRLILRSAAFLAAGVALALMVPISKNRITVSYVLIGVGTGGVLYWLWVITDRVIGTNAGIITWWGRNPLVLYLLHYILLAFLVLPGVPRWYSDAPIWLLSLQGAILLTLLSVSAWWLHGRRLIISV